MERGKTKCVLHIDSLGYYAGTGGGNPYGSPTPVFCDHLPDAKKYNNRNYIKQLFDKWFHTMDVSKIKMIKITECPEYHENNKTIQINIVSEVLFSDETKIFVAERPTRIFFINSDGSKTIS